MVIISSIVWFMVPVTRSPIIIPMLPRTTSMSPFFNYLPVTVIELLITLSLCPSILLVFMGICVSFCMNPFLMCLKITTTFEFFIALSTEFPYVFNMLSVYMLKT